VVGILTGTVPLRKVCSRQLLAVLVSAAFVAGCRRPSGTGEAKPQYVPAPTAVNKVSSTNVPQTAPSASLGLAASVAQILRAAERIGSVVEHCSCASGERVAEVHLLQTRSMAQSMEKALAEISRRYPDVVWKQGTHQAIRVTDRKQPAGLLQVRVKEFLVIEDRPPTAALPALWGTAEVAAYMHKHKLRVARHGHDRATVRRTAPTVIQVKNATVADILDRMVSGYRSGDSTPLYRLWAYRECRSGTETLIDVEMF
jgi:hypothetical protein